ncbi:tRNAm(4)X modification enzyme [Nymphaea thermarum]|nr:tRNAm(4)X modification enzyme [Nymphaea thermarum]
MEDGRCGFFLTKKKRFCANSALKGSQFCGNHNPKTEDRRVPCPIDPSHFILLENLEAHTRKCPLYKQVLALKSQSFYTKGINAGVEDEDGDASLSDPVSCTFTASKSIFSEYNILLDDNEDNELSVTSSRDLIITSDMKRRAIYKMSIADFLALLSKIKSIHQAIFLNIEVSSVMPAACSRWLKKELKQALPFQEKHALQQASILGNMEKFGLLQMPPGPELLDPGHNDSSESHSTTPAVVEFGAGRGYLTHMLTSCYNIKKVFLVERRSYKLKADRSLRQEQDVILERLRIDIEDLNLEAVESLSCIPYLAVGKHLCGPATDLTLRCCLREQYNNKKAIQSLSKCNLKGLALATCCHHLCQWKSYISKYLYLNVLEACLLNDYVVTVALSTCWFKFYIGMQPLMELTSASYNFAADKMFLINIGVTKEDFHAITWFTSWAVDADHGSTLTDVIDRGLHLPNM